jgi:hypothetical protein
MEGISNLNELIKKAREIEEQERVQADVLKVLYERVVDEEYRRLFGTPPPKNEKP